MLNIKYNTKIFIKIFLFFLIVLLVTGTSTAKTYSVSLNENADYTSIQKAIDSASNGDTIRVYPGTYTENINVNKSVEILSVSSPDDTIIEASEPSYSVLMITANSVTISGFTITGADNFALTDTTSFLPAPAGLYLNGCHNLKITGNNLLKNYYGIWSINASNNTITNNNVGSNNEGISLSGCADNTITNNIVNSNNDGVSFSDSASNTIANNVVNSNDYSGIVLTNCSKNIIENNTVTQNNFIGIGLGKSDENTLHNNTVNSDGGGITLTESNYNQLENNEAHSNEDTGFLVGNNSSNNIFVNNTADKNSFGIMLRITTNNIFKNNIISNSFGRAGVSLQYASYNEFYSNIINSNDVYGIEIFRCGNNNKFNTNQIKNNNIGVDIDNSSNSIEDNLTKNNIFEDNSNNFKTENMSQSISSDSVSSSSGSSDSGSSSSGSGGAGVSPEPQSNVEIKELLQVSITSGNFVNFDFKQNATPVLNISFDSKKTVGKTTAIVEMLINQSILVPEPPSDEVYKFINIWVGNNGFATPDNIENATVYFKVEKSWLQDKNVDKSFITFNMYNNSKWNPLQTTLAGEDSRYLYFIAETSGLSSSFAITGKAAVDATMSKTKPETQYESNTNSLKNNVSNATNLEQKQNINTSRKETKKTPGFEITLGIANLVLAFLHKRK
jgi:parallel beta-helix repeat (two copies)